ncbi:DUF1134 domain-containing protein [Pyruvatibacter sp.]|uniref:DUF1134 domain-containing protein n=1 Tax=Pyruvatibacter sp. TaxID=1981328 RepID=UPI0032F00790
MVSRIISTTPAARLMGLALLAFAFLAVPSAQAADDTYSRDEVLNAAKGFFGDVSEDMARAVDRVFSDHGRPNAYIVGEEGAGAIGVGLRYGSGSLHMKPGRVQKVYWQGPSIGWDIGGNASKVFTLVYNLPAMDDIYRRFPGVEGSLYVVGGVGVNYQQAGDTILAPMRAGAGLRAGANVGYLSYTRERRILPF